MDTINERTVENILDNLPETAESNKNKPLEEVKQTCQKISAFKPEETHKITAEIQVMITEYYSDARKQANRSFLFALIATIVGTLILIIAIVWKVVAKDTKLLVDISLITGSLIQIISALNFFLYNKASRQFSLFYACLDRTSRFMIANSLCTNISDAEKKDIARHCIIQKLINAPMVSFNEYIEANINGLDKISEKTNHTEPSKKSDVKAESMLQ